MKSNKTTIIIISIILALAVAGVVFAYLFIETDLFRSSQELFAKYFAQNAETFQKITELETAKVYENLNNEDKYETNTNIKLVHSEGGEISNPINNLSVKLDIQKDGDEQYVYLDGKILYENQEYLEAEILKDQEMYGIRFTDAIQQFITIKKEDLEDIENSTYLDADLLETLINILDGEQQFVTEEQTVETKDKYLNIITTAISNGTFSKQKNAMITYNNVTTNTNAYSVSLSSEQVGNMVIEVLNNVKNESEIIDNEIFTEVIDDSISQINENLEMPAITITVYEQKQKTIRTDLNIGQYKITIENTEQNGEVKTKINYSNLNNEEVIQYNFEIIKKNIENSENFQIIVSVVEGEEEYTITLLSEMEFINNNVQLDTEISYKQDITTIALVVKSETNIVDELKKLETFTTDNNKLLTSIPAEKRNDFIDVLGKFVTEKTYERTRLLQQKLGLIGSENENSETENTNTENQISQVEINKFNSKFEFYTGDEVSAENVKMLLDIVKNNLSGHSIIDVANSEDTEKIKTTITLYIEKDQINEENMTKILEKIDNNKKYKVLIFYKEANGLIDYITITEV